LLAHLFVTLEIANTRRPTRRNVSPFVEKFKQNLTDKYIGWRLSQKAQLACDKRLKQNN
jgi:hypothetical protein